MKNKLKLLSVILSFMTIMVNAQTFPFSYTGSVQTWTVPAGVTSIAIDAQGASGGFSGFLFCSGGCGGRVQCNIAVTAGQVLNIYVGGMGADGYYYGGSGGWNGGGNGGSSFFGGGGGGGGATDIRIGGTGLANRVLSAGGGGGGGDDYGYENGGDGGGPGAAGDGLDYGVYNSLTCGGGATSLTGGSGAGLGGGGGVALIGGDGTGYFATDGGGGGGGYYGGGGGYSGGGGGGSSYTDGVLCSAVVSTMGGTCFSDGSLTITACVPPVAGAIVGPATLCTGASAVYTNPTSSGTLSWTSSDPTIMTIGATTGVGTGVAPGVVTITCTATTACGVVTATYTVTVDLTPGPITAPANVCIGNTVTLTDATPGGTWTSLTPGVGTIDPVTGLFGGVAVGSTTVKYTLGSCSASVSINVITGPAAIAGPTSVCVGSTISLTDATGGGTWSSGSPLIASVGGTGIVTGVSVGFATISYAVGACAATDVITVTLAPTAIIGPFSVCRGGNITLTDGVSGGTWTSLSPGVATIDPVTGYVTGITVGTSVIHYTIGGCVVSATVTVTSAPGPVTGPIDLCITSTGTYTDPVPGGAWSSSVTGVATISAGGLLSPVAVGATYVIYTLGGCPQSVHVTIHDTAMQITGANTLCQGDAISLVDATGTSGVGTWSSSAPGIATVTSTTGSIFGDVVATGFGTVTISFNMPSCPSRTHVLTVNPLPASIFGSTAICVGLGTVLSDATPGGTWTSSNPLVTVSPTGVVTSSMVGITSTISYTLITGCKTTADVNVGVPPFAIHGDSAVCQGATTTLSDSTPGGVWSSTSLATAQVIDSTGFVTGISAGLVHISYTLPNGCFASMPFTVLPPLPASVTVTGPATPVCSGYLDSFIAHPVNGGTPTYFWKKFGTILLPALGSGDTMKYHPVHGDVVMCTMVTSHICSVRDTVIDTFAINVYPDSVSPVVTITTEHTDSIHYIGEIITFNANVTWGGTLPVYKWYVNGVLQPGATGSSFAVAIYTNDTVYCVVTGNPPCEGPIVAGISNHITIRAGYTGVSTLNTTGDLTLFPNPNTGNFVLSGKVDCNSCKEVAYEVVNVLGQVVYNGVAVPQNGAINEQVAAGNLAAGTYMLKVNTETGNQTFHFVISK